MLINRSYRRQSYHGTWKAHILFTADFPVIQHLNRYDIFIYLHNASGDTTISN